MNIITRFTAIFVALALVIACGEEPEDANDENDHNDHNDDALSVEEEVCLHAQEDTPLPRTASLDIDDVDPSTDNVSQTHSLFQIELQLFEDTDDYVGFVAFDVEEDDTYGLFTSTDVDVAFVDALGNEIAEVQTDNFDACPEITLQHTVELPAGDYFVHLGPSSQSEVFTVTERIGDTD